MGLVKAEMPLGVIVRRTPGVTRWARHAWRVSAVLPGAGPARWRELRREGEAIEFHAATLPLTLWSSDTEGYVANLRGVRPGITVVLQEAPGDPPWAAVSVTASAYEGQDALDDAEGLVELVSMPQALHSWIEAFCQEHHVEEAFVKRRRDRKRIDLHEDGRGDARVRQTADVYRVPAQLKARAS
jgi:hypothetical protein